MNRKLFYALLLITSLFSCKKSELQSYNLATDNIYLNYKDKDGNQDTTVLTYSFSEHPQLAKDTIWVPVIIAGKRVTHDRKFVLSIVDTATTASPNLHYEPLKPSYIMPADSGTIHVPVILKNTDPELANKSVRLTIRLTPNEDFSGSLPESMRKRSILFSSRLEQPSWWIYWMSNMGEYSRIKHQLFLIASGGTSLVDMSKPDAYLLIPRSLYYIDNLRQFLNDPFTWVARHPEKGYVLTKRTDGSTDYDFYSAASPEKKFYVKYYPQVGRYFFMDERGNQVIVN